MENKLLKIAVLVLSIALFAATSYIVIDKINQLKTENNRLNQLVQQKDDLIKMITGQMQAKETELDNTKKELEITIKDLDSTKKELQDTKKELEAIKSQQEAIKRELDNVNKKFETLTFQPQTLESSTSQKGQGEALGGK